MILSITITLLPLLCIMLLGALLLIKPQQNALRSVQKMRHSLQPGVQVKTTVGIGGMVIACSKNHVLILAPDGQKHEFLKQLVVSHETSL